MGIMYLLHIDHALNRLNIRLSGLFDEHQAEKLSADLMMRINELTDGFHILCDLTGLEKFDRSARRHYRNLMDLCRKSGVRKVIRIVPESQDNFGFTIMSYFHYNNVPVITCNDLNEALKHLLKDEAYQKTRDGSGVVRKMNLDMIKEAHVGMYGRIMRCSLGGNPEDCPLHEVRKHPVEERKVWLESKTDEEVVELYRQHINCLGHKLPETSEPID